MADDRINRYWSHEMDALIRTYNQFQTLISAKGRDGSAHVGEDGRYVEHLLKEYLRRFLPRDLEVLTGFILRPAVVCGHNDRSRKKDEHEASSQLDLLIVDTAHYPVYQRFGDSVIVPPEGVVGIISVKKHLRLKDIAHEIEMLAAASALCPHLTGEGAKARSPFTALISMEDRFDENRKKPRTAAAKRKAAYKKMEGYYSAQKPLFYDEMVDFVGALSQWGIYKKRPREGKKETFYMGFDYNKNNYAAGFQLILQNILDVYYGNLPRKMVRPGFTDNSDEGYAEKLGELVFHNHTIVRKNR